MTPADANRNPTVWPLAGLLDALRREGFQLRPDDYTSLVRVLDAFEPQSHDDLRALVAPLLVASDEEQEKFDRIFDAVWRSNDLTPVVRPPAPKRSLPWRWLIAGLVVLLAGAYVAFLWPWPVAVPSFRADIHIVGPVSPFQVGDTLTFAVDSSMRKAAGPRVRWQWERPDGRPYAPANEPTLRVVAERVGPLVVNLRSQRGRGLLLTTWTDSLRGIEYPICDQLPRVQVDTTRLSTRPLRYRFRARLVGALKTVQLTQWQLNGGVVALNQPEWEHTFRATGVPAFYDVRFVASRDTTQRLCFGEARVEVAVPALTVPPFTVDVQPTGALIRPRTQLSDTYRWALWSVGGLLALLIGYYGWLVIRDALTKKPEPLPVTGANNPLARLVSDQPPLEIPLENRDTELIARDQAFHRVVRMLRQPTESEQWRLHIDRTIRATLREGGLPTLVFEPHMAETEYLFLIDRSQVRSQQVALFTYLYRAFVEENVCAELFFFHKTFDLFTNEKRPRGLTLRQLADTYGRHTLVIWGNGYPLLYPPYPVVEPALREALADWESRAILTPVPFADWGAKERALQHDFLLLPADLTGQLRLIQALTEKKTPPDFYHEDQIKDNYSAAYVDFGEVDELRDYLGEDLFQWLAALAIYPRLRWEVVVELGRALMPPEAVNFTNLLRLARISWMHEGAFPDYTRLELLKALTPANEVKARQTLLRLFAYAEQYFPGDHFFDSEKYLLQTVSQFTLYAHDAHAFADYKPAQENFRQLYTNGFLADGAMLHYLENPDSSWTTLLPSAPGRTQKSSSKASPPRSLSLQSYLDRAAEEVIEQPAPLPAKPTPAVLRRRAVLGAALVCAFILAILWRLSLKPGNRAIDWNQQILVTIVLDTSACVTARNTSVTDDPRWTIFLDDSLFSISNLRATRPMPLRNSIVLSNDVTADSARLRTVLLVKDTTGQQQARTVAFNRDTLHVRINCPSLVVPVDSPAKATQAKPPIPVRTLPNKVRKTTPRKNVPANKVPAYRAAGTAPAIGNSLSTNALTYQAPNGNNLPATNAREVSAVQNSPVQNSPVQTQTAPEDPLIAAGLKADQGGYYEEAIRQYDQVLAKTPNTARVWNLKGNSLFRLKRYDEAIGALLTAVKTDQKYALAYVDLARVYCATGKFAEANDAIRQATSLQPDLRQRMQSDKEFMSLCGKAAN